MVKSSRNSPLIYFNGMVLRKNMPVRYLGMNRRGDYGFVLTSNDEV